MQDTLRRVASMVPWRPSAAVGARLALGAAMSSGAATLVYELVWLRDLTLSVGATFPAITVVLTSFMLGLGLGSIIGGRLADRQVNPLRAYAGVELVVGLLALAFPAISALVGAVDISLAGPFSGRAILAGLALLPATTLMGTTFPLLSAALHADDASARHVPWLYGANTLGATVGATLGGLVLPFAIGILPSLFVAFGLNVLAAALAGVASFGPLARDVAKATDHAAEPTERPPRASLLLVLSCGSGALIMLTQLFWTRAILQLDRQNFASVVIEPSDAMTLVLVLVLLGNAMGSLLATRLADRSATQIARIVGLCWVAGGVLSLGGIEWIGVEALGAGQEEGFLSSYAVYLRLIPSLFPALLLGVGFPLLVRLYTGALAGHGERLGRVWWANTLGAAAGTVGGGWWLMPAVGTDRGLLLCAALALGLAGVALVYAQARARDFAPLAVGVAITAGVAIAVPLGPGQAYRSIYGDEAIIATWEGWEATTIVWQANEFTKILTTNGRSITARDSLVTGGRDSVDLAPDAEQVLVVGFGTGLFAKGFLDLPRLKQLVIVEIDGAQFASAAHFDVEEILTDPRVKLVVDDAVHYLSTSEQAFDLVIIDAWGPDASPAVYTANFNELVLKHLTKEGMLWSKVNPLVPDAMSAVKDSFRCVFPYAYLFDNGKNTSALMGVSRERMKYQRFRLTPADSACDPLTHENPRRLRTDYAQRLKLPPPPPK